MKVNQCFLHGFMTGETAKVPLTITGDADELILRKGEGFDEWMADTTKIIYDDAETTYTAQNQEMLKRIVVAWLRGEEFNP